MVDNNLVNLIDEDHPVLLNSLDGFLLHLQQLHTAQHLDSQVTQACDIPSTQANSVKTCMEFTVSGNLQLNHACYLLDLQ